MISMVAQDERRTKPFHDLPGFAKLFIRTRAIRSHKDVRTEDLAEAFRHHMGLPPFPDQAVLEQLARDLKIELAELPQGSPIAGANASLGTEHTIFIASRLPKHFTESTLGHELREVIERAMQFVDPAYQGLDTSDNRNMHGESEFFGLCLLMQAEATHKRFVEIGFDLVLFAEERGRSLPSVLMRAQSMYAGLDPWPGPVAGIWLFDRTSALSGAAPSSFRVKHRASLRGFSTNKGGAALAKRAHLEFPKPGSAACDFPPAKESLELGKPTLHAISLNDLFGEEDYTVLSEPRFTRSPQPSRVVVTAVRKDCVHMMTPMMERLGLLD